MRITTTTTDDEITAVLAAARRQLIGAAEMGTSAEELASLVNGVAEAEGRVAARTQYRTHLITLTANGASAEEAAAAAKDGLIAVLFNPVGDTYSGRANDARRARHDGMRAEIQHLVNGWS